MAVRADHLDPPVAPDDPTSRRAARGVRRRRSSRSPAAPASASPATPAGASAGATPWTALVPPAPAVEPVVDQHAAGRRRWTETSTKLLERLTVVEDAIMGAFEDAVATSPGAVDVETAVRAAREIAADTASFGLRQASNQALSIAEGLLAVQSPDDPRLQQLCRDVTALHQELAPPSNDEVTPDDTTGWASLVVYSEDRRWAEQIRSEASVRGLRAERVTGLVDLMDALREQPDALVVDLSDGHELLATLAGNAPPVCVAVSSSDRLRDRVELAHAGVSQMLPAEASARDTVDAATALITGHRLNDARALVWAPPTDERVDIGLIAVALGEVGIEIIEAEDVATAWDAIVTHRPDLLIASEDVDGIETLCRVVRADAHRASLPIIALQPPHGPTSARLYAAGTDDVLPLTKDPADIAARARHLIVRSRLQQKRAELDPLTGLVNEAGALRAVERMSSVATRQQTPLAIGAIQVDGFGPLNERHGRVLGDDVLRAMASRLRQFFRGTDVVARLEASEFLVAFHGADRDQAAIRLRELAESLKGLRLTSPSGVPIRITLSAGVAALPSDGHDMQAVRRAAAEALREARALGGDQVVAATTGSAAPAEQDVVDVAVIESDRILAELLLEALRTRGWRTQHVADGEQALQLLTGPHPSLRARVVLLDVDLPGHDGFTIMRRLSDAGTLKDTRVVVVTSRVTEAETVAAFEAGASDHVAKPFSLPVLMERVRVALGPGS